MDANVRRIAILLAFLFAWALRSSERLQGVVLKEGHSVGEIKPFLVLFQLASGVGMVAFAAQLLVKYT
jgi:hypothetical protein